jgi:hypothetical protein
MPSLDEHGSGDNCMFGILEISARAAKGEYESPKVYSNKSLKFILS